MDEVQPDKVVDSKVIINNSCSNVDVNSKKDETELAIMNTAVSNIQIKYICRY